MTRIEAKKVEYISGMIKRIVFDYTPKHKEARFLGHFRGEALYTDSDPEKIREAFLGLFERFGLS